MTSRRKMSGGRPRKDIRVSSTTRSRGEHSEEVSIRMEVKINGATICIIDKEIAGQVQAVNWQQMCDDYIKQLSFEKMQELAVSEAASRRDVV